MTKGPWFRVEVNIVDELCTKILDRNLKISEWSMNDAERMIQCGKYIKELLEIKELKDGKS